jgi:hypothetical protein
MSTPTHIQELLREIGPLLPAIHEIRQSEDELSWAIALENGGTIVVDIEDEGERMILRSEIGTAAEDDAALSTMLLRFNGLWQQTGGICLGLDEEVVVMCHDVSANGIDTPTLCAILAGFAEKSEGWRRLLANRSMGLSLPTDGATTDTEDMIQLLGSGIRA